MKIDSISVRFPSRVVSLAETLEMIEFYSRQSFRGDAKRLIKIINKILVYSGAEKRRWLSSNEKAIDLIQDAVLEVLNKSNTKITDIDLLIYTGIGRGFIEPGGSYVLAKNLGMKSVECFDVLDACMSWTRAMHIAYQYLVAGFYKKILIVNAEFNSISEEAFFPKNYQLSSLDQIKWTFPSYTMGDATTATLLSNSRKEKWEWHFESRPQLADLCTIPSVGASFFTNLYEKIGKNGPGRFCSFGNEMHQMGTPEVINILSKLSLNKDKIKMIFPHASSKQAWAHCAEVCEVADKMYYVYPDYGNLVSASVPAGISLALQQNKISYGDKLVAWVGSAGMSFATVGFEL